MKTNTDQSSDVFLEGKHFSYEVHGPNTFWYEAHGPTMPDHAQS